MYIYAHIYFLSASCVSEFPLATSYDSELHVNRSFRLGRNDEIRKEYLSTGN